jgi:hypothetical protein
MTKFVRNELGQVFIPLGQQIHTQVVVKGQTWAKAKDTMTLELKLRLIGRVACYLLGALALFSSIAFFLVVL